MKEVFMLRELERSVLPFSAGEANFYLRFDNRALLETEKCGYDFFEIAAEGFTLKAARCFLKCGLRHWAESGTYDRDTIADKLMAALSADRLSDILTRALLLAMPEPILGAKSEKNEKGDFSKIFYFFCDIMGKPEELFWELTLREVFERWNSYAVFHGYMKAPIEVRRYDD